MTARLSTDFPPQLWQHVPAPNPPATSPDSQPTFLDVRCRRDEDVKWLWLTLPDGTRKIVGYEIVKKQK